MELTSLHFTIIVGILTFGVSACMCFFLFHYKEHQEVVKLAFEGGWLMAILTASFIVVSTAALTAAGKIEGAAAATIFSGIAGYVLGVSTGKEQGAKSKDNEPTG